MKGLKVFVVWAIILLLFLVLQTEAKEKEIEKYKITFMFQANDNFCIINLRDPLGESSYLGKLEIAPIIVNEDLFLPMNDFIKMIGGTIIWDSEKHKITISFQGDEISFEFSLEKSPEILFQNEEAMLSAKFIISNFCPSESLWSKELKIIILTWPLAI